MIMIGICQRCHRPITGGQPYMPRIPLIGGWRGFDHQWCPPRIASTTATNLTFTYTEEHFEPLLKEGATIGHVIIHTGPGPARIADAVALVDPDGIIAISTGEFRDTTVVDDTWRP